MVFKVNVLYFNKDIKSIISFTLSITLKLLKSHHVNQISDIHMTSNRKNFPLCLCLSFYPGSWGPRLLVLGADNRRVFSYWDVLEEGCLVFLKMLASSSSCFLQENGSHYMLYILDKRVRRKKVEADRTMVKCNSWMLDAWVENHLKAGNIYIFINTKDYIMTHDVKILFNSKKNLF